MDNHQQKQLEMSHDIISTNIVAKMDRKTEMKAEQEPISGKKQHEAYCNFCPQERQGSTQVLLRTILI